MRDSVARRPLIVAAVAILVLLASGGAIWWHAAAPPPLRQPRLWYMDLNKGQLFAGSGDLAPIEAPGGPVNHVPTGVLAHVYACGDCSNAGDRSVAWLETLDPAVQKAMGSGATYLSIADATASDFNGGRRVQRPKDGEWVDAYSEEGTAIQQPPACPGGAASKPCLPAQGD